MARPPAYNPIGDWTNKHQMPINVKRDNFLKDDLISVGKEMNIRSSHRIIGEIIEVVSEWPKFAKDAGVEARRIKLIGKTHRLL